MPNLRYMIGIVWICSCFQPLQALAASSEPAVQKHNATQSSGGVTVFSIVPVQAEPGGWVQITAAGLTDQTKISLGGDEIPWQWIDERRIRFAVPQTAGSGQYVLSVSTPGGAARSYVFSVIPLKPIALSVEPDRITSCTNAEIRDVTLHGRNFTETSQLMFDGAIIRSRFISSEALSFQAPAVKGGLHQVLVRNGEVSSLPLGFSIISTPEISLVTIGDNHVSSYELIIEGYNFQQNSRVMVDGVQVDVQGFYRGESLAFVDCTRLIYKRRPFSSTPQDLRIQVINPGGEASRTVVISAP